VRPEEELPEDGGEAGEEGPPHPGQLQGGVDVSKGGGVEGLGGRRVRQERGQGT